MTCDHAVNVNCNARQPTNTNTNTDNNLDTEDWQGDIVNSVENGERLEPTFRVTESEISTSMSSEKIAIIVLVFILLAVCLAISFCFRERIKEVAGPYLDQLSPDKLKVSSPSTLGLLKPYTFTKPVWPSATNKAAQMRYTVSPGLSHSSLAVRELPPVPSAPSGPGAPVPPPRRKKSVVEIQTGLSPESDNTQSIA